MTSAPPLPLAPRAGGDGRRVIALVGSGLTPYRVHLLRRLATELPEFRWVSLNTNHPSAEPWTDAPPADLHFEHLDKRARPRTGLREHLASWSIGGAAIARLKALKPAAVIVSGYHRPSVIRVIRWCAAHQVPVMLTADTNLPSERSKGMARVLKSRVVRRAVRACDSILVCGSMGARYFEHYGARPGQCVYAPYEPDYARVANVSPQMIAEVRQTYRLDPQRRRVVFCGRLSAQKRPDLVIDAFAAAAIDHPEWDLLMVGDGHLRSWLQARVPLDLRERVTFAGFVPNPDRLYALYHCCDAMVLPSDWEPWGVVVNEALAAGLAVVASNVVGAAVELVRSGVNGLLVDPNNRVQLTEAMQVVMTPGRVDAFKAASAQVLGEWRTRADPVAGVRTALVRASVVRELPPQPSPALAASTALDAAKSPPRRPRLAFVGGGLTPYRIHLNFRLKQEHSDIDQVLMLTRHPFFEPWKMVEVPGLRVLHLDPTPPPKPWWGRDLLNQWSIGRDLKRTLAREAPDAVIFHSYDHLAHLRGLNWCKQQGIPAYLYVDSNIHHDSPTLGRALIKRQLVQWVARRVKKILVFGSLGRKFYERYGVPGDHCLFCPMEPDYGLIERTTEADVSRALAKFRLDPARKRFVFVGRMTMQKRPDLTVEAFCRIADDAPDWDLLMIGDGPMRAECERKVPASLRDRIIWTGFLNDQPMLTALYCGSHCLVLPSDFEPWALVVNEAARSGLALITTKVVGASAELLKDGVNGRAVPVNDVPALASAMREVTEPGAAERMGEASQAIVAEWRRVADPVRQLCGTLREAGVLGV